MSDLSRLMATRPVFDAHADSLQLALDLGRDHGERGAGHLDLVRGREGGLGSLVFVSWCDPKFIDAGPHGARDRTRGLLREFHRLAERHPAQVSFAGNAVELARARANGRLAGIPGIEGGHSIEGSLEGAGIPEGLSDFGRTVVRRMNELGIVIDLSHAGRQSFFDTLETTQKPVIASHSGCMAVNAHQRNLDDEQLRALAANGGVVGIVFCTPFLDAAARAEEQRLRETAEYKALRGANDTELFLAQCEFLQRAAVPLPLERVLDHLCHAVEVAGIEHVGLGSDYDGIQRTPQGLEDASTYPALAAGMARRGFREDEISLVLGGNMERVYAAVTGPGSAAASSRLLPVD
ncbi:MAG: membrane dipeptidase [Planctomycetota bacterium]|nr:membrane dipeptidase [Planctomycetota bacterium]